jgi:hypothetical protein
MIFNSSQSIAIGYIQLTAVREFLYRPPPWPATVAASCVKVVVSISFFNF